MATSDEVTQERGAQRMQDFFFARELAEVYLLLDHLSGRSDKTLTSLIDDGKEKAGNGLIRKVCEIGWQPRGTASEQAGQAVTLLLAKDRLNTAAKPANGASIAFTLLVAGDDDGVAVQPKYALGPWHWLRGRERTPERRQMPASVKGGDSPPSVPAGSGGAGNSAPPIEAASNVAPTIPQRSGAEDNGTGDSALPPSGIWGDQSPSRLSLARKAYPGLVNRARQFNRRITIIIFLLLFWLIFTCLLSWNITAGRAILARLDAIETAKTSIFRRIAAAEVGSTPDASASSSGEVTPPTQGASPTPDPSVLSKPRLVVRYCERPHLLPPAQNAPAGVVIRQFDNATQRQICDEYNDNLLANRNSHEDLADWLAPWRLLLKAPSHQICGREECRKGANVLLLDDSKAAMNTNGRPLWSRCLQLLCCRYAMGFSAPEPPSFGTSGAK
jgi:hypothetical protein